MKVMTFFKKTSVVLLVLLLSAASASAAPKAELWPHWQTNAPQSQIRIEHSAWSAFLQKYLVVASDETPNLLRYAAVTQVDRQLLADYLSKLSSVTPTRLNRPEQKAYWINLYNALTVKTILDHYPVESIRDIKSGWFSAGPWDLKLIKVDGLELSLNDIEHRILRPIWQDSRIHYAVNCASYSCPNLQPEAFSADNSAPLLDQAARAYVNSPRGVRLAGDNLVLSSIYDWYQVDFGENQAALLDYLQTLSLPELAARLKTFQGTPGTISFDYDWRLNAE
jgi:hypothetical protein